MRARAKDKHDNWLLIKGDDEEARPVGAFVKRTAPTHLLRVRTRAGREVDGDLVIAVTILMVWF